MLGLLRLWGRVAWDAFDHFNDADGWAIASHIALSSLLALFPFLILVTSLAASFFGSKELADEVARLLLETWPEEVAGPIAREIHTVLTSTRGDLLTISVALAVFFASSGIESLRIGLNRAYGMVDRRNWLLLRAGIDRLCAGRRNRTARAGAADRARAADLHHSTPICAGAGAVRMGHHADALRRG